MRWSAFNTTIIQENFVVKKFLLLAALIKIKMMIFYLRIAMHTNTCSSDIWSKNFCRWCQWSTKICCIEILRWKFSATNFSWFTVYQNVFSGGRTHTFQCSFLWIRHQFAFQKDCKNDFKVLCIKITTFPRGFQKFNMKFLF